MSKVMIDMDEFSRILQRKIFDIKWGLGGRPFEEFLDVFEEATCGVFLFPAGALEVQKEIKLGDARSRWQRNNINVGHGDALALKAIINRSERQTAIVFSACEAFFRNIRDHFDVHNKRGTAIVPDMNAENSHHLCMSRLLRLVTGRI